MEKENTIVLPADRKASDLSQAPAEERGFFRPADQFLTIQAATTHVTPEKVKLDLSELDHLTDVYSRYEIIERFAEGGQGEIKTALDRLLKRYVAIKSLKRDHLGNQEIIANFIAEAKVTAQLDHPSIIPLYEVNGDDEDRIHIAMKLIHGSTLDDVIEDTILDCKLMKDKRTADDEAESLKSRLENFIKVCEAMHYAHKKNVIHRDLKPENIMIGQYHEVYVMDWGIAKVIPESGNDEAPDPNGLCGTPGYIAPEVIEKQAYAPASDQYALGVILFELSTLKHAMKGQTMTEVLQKTCAGKLETLEHYYPQYEIPDEIQAIIMKATALNPADRYQSVDALADDIRRFLHGEETLALPDDQLRRLSRKLFKHKTLTASVVLFVLLLLAGVAIFSLVRQKQAIIESKKRELKMGELHGAVADQAHRIDCYFMQIGNMLERFSDRLLFLLNANAAGGICGICEYRSFREGQQLPQGTVKSKYYGQNVSMAAANYKLAPGVELDSVKKQLDALNPVVADLLPYMTGGVAEYQKMGYDELREKALTTGLPVPWIYVGFETGLLVNYPGSGGTNDDYDPRARPWYKAAKDGYAIAWSSPYVDAFGLGVVMSASRSLRDRQGRLLGVTSFDMTFAHVMTLLNSGKERDIFVTRRFLIDGEGNVLISSKLDESKVKDASKDFSNIKFDKFPYSQISSEIKKHETGQFEVGAKGRVRLICYAPVKTLGWYYVEEIALRRMLEN